MPIEVGVWKLGQDDTAEQVQFSGTPTENRLEELLDRDISILDPRLLVIGRQVMTGFGKFIDLLAIDADGNLVVIELKRDRTYRDIVAQVLDYASWVQTLADERIAEIFADYQSKYHPGDSTMSLDQAFAERLASPTCLNR